MGRKTREVCYLFIIYFYSYFFLFIFFFVSLVATIKKAGKGFLELMEASALPIPEEVPPKFFDRETPYVEDIGEPTNACFFELSNIDPKGWYVYFY